MDQVETRPAGLWMVARGLPAIRDIIPRLCRPFNSLSQVLRVAYGQNAIRSRILKQRRSAQDCPGPRLNTGGTCGCGAICCDFRYSDNKRTIITGKTAWLAP